MSHLKRLRDCTKKNNEYENISVTIICDLQKALKQIKRPFFWKKKPGFERCDLLYKEELHENSSPTIVFH